MDGDDPMVVDDVFRHGRVWCLGMGGGCDVLTAYVVSRHLFPDGPNPTWLYGNVKRRIKGLNPIGDSKYLWTVPPEVIPIDPAVNLYGTCLIDMSLPRGPEGSPIILNIPHKTSLPSGAQLTELLAGLSRHIVEVLKVDAIIGVDAGGDSVTGGIDFPEGDPMLGTDMLALQVLKGTGLPFLHIVAGMGCDGETRKDDIRKEVAARVALGTFRGSVDMADWAPTYRAVSVGLTPDRTPCIMADALEGRLDPDENGDVEIPRCLKPRIPVRWLQRAYAFTHPM